MMSEQIIKSQKGQKSRGKGRIAQKEENTRKKEKNKKQSYYIQKVRDRFPSSSPAQSYSLLSKVDSPNRGREITHNATLSAHKE